MWVVEWGSGYWITPFLKIYVHAAYCGKPDNNGRSVLYTLIQIINSSFDLKNKLLWDEASIGSYQSFEVIWCLRLQGKIGLNMLDVPDIILIVRTVLFACECLKQRRLNLQCVNIPEEGRRQIHRGGNLKLAYKFFASIWAQNSTVLKNICQVL